MPTANLGRVQPIYKGVYNAATDYAPLDLVKYSGTVYWCIGAVTGVAPPAALYWVALSAQELTDYGITATAAELNTLDGLLAGTDELNLLTTSIGRPFAVWDHITGCPIPSNAGTVKFIKLTAGLTGSGAYNNGLLSGESVSGTAPAITATATIVGGPMNGQTVPLVNTEQAFIRPRTTSGVLQATATQGHGHRTAFGFNGTDVYTYRNAATGQPIYGSDVVSGTYLAVGNAGPFGPASIRMARTEAALVDAYGETIPRNRSATFYMRII